MLGKLEDLDFSLLESRFNLQYLEFSHEDAMALEKFPTLVRHDPFDRALLAHAHNRRALFLTSDRRLLELGLNWVLDSKI